MSCDQLEMVLHLAASQQIKSTSWSKMQSPTVREMCPGKSMWCSTAWWRLNSLGPEMRWPQFHSSLLSPAFWFQNQSLAQVKIVHVLSPYLKLHSWTYTFPKAAWQNMLCSVPQGTFQKVLLKNQNGTEVIFYFFMKTAQSLQLPPSHAIMVTWSNQCFYSNPSILQKVS